MSLAFVDASASSAPSFVPEAAVNIYQGVNAITRIFRKTCENTEQVVDLGFKVMQLTLVQQQQALEQRQLSLLN